VLRLPSLDGWDGVYLKYSPDWPLQLLLTPEAMRVYNAIFRYLFRLRRLHMALDGAWRVASGSPSWHLRQHMAYLVSNLQYYLQIDVIDTQSTVLNTAIAQATDFTELRTAHEAFLGALVAQSFLDVPPISVQIERLFALCLSLCGIVQRTDVEGREACSSQVAQLAALFERASSQLYMILHGSKLSASSRAPSLRQFLLRLNFNGFVARTARHAARVAANCQ
jgi:gamma-tubulin complex component 4